MLLGMKKKLIAMLLGIVCAAPVTAQLVTAQLVTAQLGDAGPKTESKCEGYLQTPLPADALSVAAPRQWPDCESYKSYSGIGREEDFAAARQCAWSERLAQQANIEPRYTEESIFGGSAMLTVLYANGEGVEQNKPLALRFACESELADQGIEDILALPNEVHVTGKKFKYCDEAFTTFEMNFCAAYGDEIAARKRQDEMDQLSNRWPQTDKDVFAALEHAEEAYVTAHGGGETYLGGTIRNLRVDGVEERQRDNFLAAVKGFESGRLPTGTEADYGKADSDLNATYRMALALAAKQNFAEDDGLIRPEGIQKAERAWLAYRDAWVNFAQQHFQGSDRNAWLTLLTRNRYWSLRRTLCDVGWDDAACKGAAKED
jgi:uncharacterized protein YecT (DUF1311 family)